jgi:hypothetical protein
MSGYEVCEAVRAIPALATKPIILLTGTFEKFDEEKFKSCGADDSMAKPFESQQIVTKVKEMLELGSSRSEVPAAAAPAAPAPVEEPAPAAASSDIWDAFTPDEPAQPAEPAVSDASSAFEMLQEVPEMEAPPARLDSADESTGSKWIPAEEETFDFPEETSAGLDPAAFEAPADEPAGYESTFEAPEEEQTVFESSFDTAEEEQTLFEPAFEAPAEEPAFEAPADVPAFEAPAEEPAAFEPAFTEPTAPVFSEPEPPAPAFVAPAPAVAAAPVAAVAAEVSEEQLRAAIAGASREVIERIVWEVVPDLAETMIREAIQKIKQGA